MEGPWPPLLGITPPQPLTHLHSPPGPPAPTHSTVASLQATARQRCQGPVVQAQGFAGDILERVKKPQTPGTGQAQSQLNQ